MNRAEELIKKSASQGDSVDRIARKVYLMLPTHAFKDAYDIQLDLFSEISSFVDIPISSIHIIGSAKTGISLVKGTTFSSEKSDIDIAIVDPSLYTKKFEHSFQISNGWKNLSTFSANPVDAANKRKQFLDYLDRGVFCPNCMPHSPDRAEWLSFFGRLSDTYSHFCNGISAWIYASEYFLTYKQQSAIKKYLADKGLT
ncbi:MAG: hypothetical protein CVU35_07065 [Betaproteobacteria bacterium HGW-Betaproteobacteria-8]|nr:MAG: hypothetical protein CVU35_07065 [Betaproteobacteria bacterium HGW-Betaproteobacteria-8]